MPVNPSANASSNPQYWNREPDMPDAADVARVGGRVLDPVTAFTVEGVNPRATIYVADTLLMPPIESNADLAAQLNEAANALGWALTPDESIGRFRTSVNDRQIGVTRLRIVVPGGSGEAPDAWKLLQSARAVNGAGSLPGVGLEHLLTSGPGHWSSKPGHWSPKPGHWSSKPADSYGTLGSDGRLPMAYTGPRPRRRTASQWRDLAVGGRPVVAVLDTGCGDHPWFNYTDEAGDAVRIVDESVELDGAPIGFGFGKNPPDPEVNGDYEGPLDGVIDAVSGHGTFICGLVNQQCPDANILAWRVVQSGGFIREGDVVDAVVAITELVQRRARGGKDGHRIDVLNLSMGFYHESADDALTEGSLLACLQALAQCGTTVVCSAGNDATSREVYPAAFAPTINKSGYAPMCSVGALNPNETTVALFSNTGDWVTHYDVGAAVMSTMPAFEGGLLPIARTESPWGLREDLDPDDFTTGLDPNERLGGFGLWSGTSFAAPMLAGRIAESLIGQQQDRGDDGDGRLGRIGRAVARVRRITR